MIACAKKLPRKIIASDHVAAAPALCKSGVSARNETNNPAAQYKRCFVDNADGAAPFGPQPNQPQIAAAMKTICSAALANKSA